MISKYFVDYSKIKILLIGLDVDTDISYSKYFIFEVYNVIFPPQRSVRGGKPFALTCEEETKLYYKSLYDFAQFINFYVEIKIPHSTITKRLAIQRYG